MRYRRLILGRPSKRTRVRERPAARVGPRQSSSTGCLHETPRCSRVTSTAVLRNRSALAESCGRASSGPARHQTRSRTATRWTTTGHSPDWAELCNRSAQDTMTTRSRHRGRLLPSTRVGLRWVRSLLALADLPQSPPRHGDSHASNYRHSRLSPTSDPPSAARNRRVHQPDKGSPWGFSRSTQ